MYLLARLHRVATRLAVVVLQEGGYLELKKPGTLSHCKEECETIAKVCTSKYVLSIYHLSLHFRSWLGLWSTVLLARL